MLPSIDIFGITISEPTTTVTDYLITAVAWRFAFSLYRQGRAGRMRVQSFWSLGFLFIGIGALLGGTSHGFATYLGDAAYFRIWKATVYTIGLSMLFAVAGTINGSPLGNTIRNVFHAINVAAFAIYAIWMVGHSNFVYVIYHYVPAMIAIAMLQVWALVRHHSAGAPWLIAGVLTALLGATIQQSGFSLHRHFNHNDLYHVIQILGLFLLYRGARLLNGPQLPA